MRKTPRTAAHPNEASFTMSASEAAAAAVVVVEDFVDAVAAATSEAALLLVAAAPPDPPLTVATGLAAEPDTTLALPPDALPLVTAVEI